MMDNHEQFQFLMQRIIDLEVKLQAALDRQNGTNELVDWALSALMGDTYLNKK